MQEFTTEQLEQIRVIVNEQIQQYWKKVFEPVRLITDDSEPSPVQDHTVQESDKLDQ